MIEKTKALILAAGEGKRLHPITKERPKALVEIQKGLPLLKMVIEKIQQLPVEEIIVNTFYLAEQIIEYLQNNTFSVPIRISSEQRLLDTGGAIRHAHHLLKGAKNILVHNVDVVSDIDLQQLIQSHEKSQSLATLAVRSRKTARYFLFDESNRMCGWQKLGEPPKIIRTRDSQHQQPLSFMGIHVISPEIFAHLPDTDIFSIVDAYLEISKTEEIKAFRADKWSWLDAGKPDSLAQIQNVNSPS
jgi:NDP-sugar pyrophosphorylase family protein